MINKVSHITVTVRNQDEALDFYKEKMGFEKCIDQLFGEKRWLTVTPKGEKSPEFVLWDPDGWVSSDEAQRNRELIGKAPIIVLATDNCDEDYKTLAAKGVQFISKPKVEPWGKEATFLDLYGNPFILSEPPH